MAQRLRGENGGQEEYGDVQKSGFGVVMGGGDIRKINPSEGFDEKASIILYKTLRHARGFPETMVTVVDHSPMKEVPAYCHDDGRFEVGVITPISRERQMVPDPLRVLDYCKFDAETVRQLYGIKMPALVIRAVGPGVNGILLPEESDAQKSFFNSSSKSTSPRLILSESKGLRTMRPVLVPMEKQMAFLNKRE